MFAADQAKVEAGPLHWFVLAAGDFNPPPHGLLAPARWRPCSAAGWPSGLPPVGSCLAGRPPL
eukprot:5346353-Lingulodinium_polyedra.AAC.1